jgi:2-methylcitrate dehydratase
MSPRVEVEYPLGHRRRRGEGIPLLIEKFQSNLATRFNASCCEQILSLCADRNQLERTPVGQFMEMFISP